MKAPALKRLPDLLMLFFGISIFVFLIYKSATSSFTHDESFTYLLYQHQSFQKIVSFSDSYTNNHILNTLLMKYSEQIFGNSELALRLPNLLAFLLYMIFGWLMFRKSNRVLGLSIFLLLIANMPLVDLFGMARGYGLSFGLMVVSLYFLLRFFESRKKFNLYLFHVSALLASMASFTLLTFYLAMIMLFVIFMVVEKVIFQGKNMLLQNTIISFLVPLLISATVLYEPVRRVIKFNKLDFGGSSGFFDDTVKQLIITATNQIHISTVVILVLQVVFTAVVFLGVFIAIRMLFQKKQEQFQKFPGLLVSGFLLLFISAIFIAQHHVLGTSYPVSRFSVFLYPLFVIHLGFIADYFFGTKYKYVILPVVTGLAFLAVIGFTVKSELTSFGEWGYDANTRAMLVELEKNVQDDKAVDGQITLGANWMFEPTVNFYRITKSLDWLRPVTRDSLSQNFDYFYIFNDGLSRIENLNYEIIARYDDTGTLLIRNESELTR